MALVLCAGMATPISVRAQSNANYEFASPQEIDAVKGEVPSRASSPASPSIYPAAVLGQGYVGEMEPNGTFGTASPLTGSNLVVRANIFPAADVDYFSFTAAAGDRVYASTMTSASAGSSTDTQLTLFASDGTTPIEFDDDNGSLAGLSSSIAGARIATAGTYFIRVNAFSATASIRPYELHFRLQSGAPTPETEPNDTPATANVLPASGWVSGARDPAAATEQDWFSLTLNAGDTVYLGLDLDPERDGVTYNGRLGLALFGDAANQILVVDDAGSAETPPPGTPLPASIPSEALFFTVKTAGTYYAFVDSASAATGGPTATYNLSVSVHPATNEGVACTTYTSADAPQPIGPGATLTSSTITVPGNPRIADVDVSIVLNHTIMNQIDAHLRSPANNDIGLFTDIGASAVGGQNMMDITFDDEAGIPPTFTVLRGVQLKPELNYRLHWLDGENAGGVWTLDLRDDIADANGGTLTSWSLRICEAPPPPTCAAGFTTTTVFATDFETGAAGFTSNGTANEWELGTPATLATTTANPIAPFLTCNSGTNCWKTDLDNTYDISSNQNLVSPNINLAGLSPPITVNWAQRYQLESANFDHVSVDFQQVGGAPSLRLFEFLDATMTDGVGNPIVNIGASAGWGQFSRRADSLAGLNTELVFHLDSDSSVNFGGLAIDDVSVTACRALAADLSITKTDGVTTATPGGSVTYTITASNPVGGDPVTGATVTDTFPASLSCSTTCAGVGGGTCTTGPFTGNINDTVNLPAGASVTYTSVCQIAASATGTLSNTATITSATDPNPANNSATDMDTVLAPSANLGITKTNGTTTVAPGGTTVYTIVASNTGPSNAPGTNVTDTFPASLTCTYTCAMAGGATGCTAGSGNINQTVNLPVSGSVTYTATCAVSGAATGTISNTATVAPGAGVTDPVPGNNSATDTDTVAPPSADLSITKTDGRTTATQGSTGSYTIVVGNAGPNAATATVNDTVPAGFTVSGFTCTGTGGATCPATGGASQVIAAPVSLPVGSTATFVVNGTYSQVGTVSNTATVTITAPATDPVAGNNSATDTTTVGSPANVSGTKTITANTSTPGLIPTTMTIVLTNNGTGTQLDNPGNEFDDVLGQGFIFGSVTSTSGVVAYDPATRTVSFNGSIAAGASVTITITGQINRFDVPGGTFSNQGTIRFDADGNGTNESTALTDDPSVPGAANPTVLVLGSGGIVGVPALDRLGLLLMLLSFGLFGAVTLRNRE